MQKHKNKIPLHPLKHRKSKGLYQTKNRIKNKLITKASNIKKIGQKANKEKQHHNL